MDTNSTWSSITALRTEYLYFVPKLWWGFVNSKISHSHMYTQKSIHFLAWTRGTRSKCKYLAGSLFLYIFLPSSSLKIFFYLCISCFLNVFTLLKVSYFQNVFFVSSIGPKYQQKFFQDFCLSLKRCLIKKIKALYYTNFVK